ncbi:MAG: 2-oxoacid:acceptor oxidoreductase family protein [Promethearchaeota archaeon]|nr:MAG: 2-oxoacid:acceptor oxidoreductase family protein [Candidatus Lokiarchaeota archaeon]
MTFDNYTIVITGLGGQGLIRLIQILGNALLNEGHKVITSETHGLSQRGGKVTCFLRFGKRINAPIPMIGSAEMIIALELTSILDALKYAKPNKTTNLVISTYEKQTFNSEDSSLKYILDALIGVSNNIFIIPAMDVAIGHTSNLKTMNIVILGYILNFLPLNKKNVEESLVQYFTGTNLEMNIKAFNEGFKLKY